MLTRITPIFAVANWTRAHSALEARVEHSPGEKIDGGVELGVRVAEVLMDGDERVGVRDPSDGALEILADRLAQERPIVGAVGVGHGHRTASFLEPA